MNYSLNPNQVRVEIFKKSNKWYTTVELNWDRYSSKTELGTELIHETFIRCMKEQYADSYTDMIAICFDPYHEHSHPLMINL